MLIHPLKPTIKRFLNIFIFNSKLSIFRSLQYERFFSLRLYGKVLDFGGGEFSNYRDLIQKNNKGIQYESVNISSDMYPTYLIKANSSIPVDDNSYDFVFSLNTLEHVFDIDFALAEMLRLLKPGGTLIISVPFLFRIHGCPDDYHRQTSSWWIQKLKNLKMQTIQIEPLVWDFLISRFALAEGVGIFSRLFKVFFGFYGLLYAYIKSRNTGERYDGDTSKYLSNVATGYLILAKKV